MVASRKAVRKALGVMLASIISDEAVSIVDYQATDIKSVAPAVVLTSAGTQRKRITMRGSSAVFTVDVHIFVLHISRKDGWTESDAEDLLDDIEQQICEAVDNNQSRTGAWSGIRYSDTTNARDSVTLGGTTYLHEVIPLEITAL